MTRSGYKVRYTTESGSVGHVYAGRLGLALLTARRLLDRSDVVSAALLDQDGRLVVDARATRLLSSMVLRQADHK